LKSEAKLGPVAVTHRGIRLGAGNGKKKSQVPKAQRTNVEQKKRLSPHGRVWGCVREEKLGGLGETRGHKGGGGGSFLENKKEGTGPLKKQKKYGVHRRKKKTVGQGGPPEAVKEKKTRGVGGGKKSEQKKKTKKTSKKKKRNELFRGGPVTGIGEKIKV